MFILIRTFAVVLHRLQREIATRMIKVHHIGYKDVVQYSYSNRAYFIPIERGYLPPVPSTVQYVCLHPASCILTCIP